jgi:hypothetical protein
MKLKQIFIIGVGLVSIFLCGCNSGKDAKIAELQNQVATMQSQADQKVTIRKIPTELANNVMGYMTKTGKFHYMPSCRYYKADHLNSWGIARQAGAVPCKFCIKLESKNQEVVNNE